MKKIRFATIFMFLVLSVSGCGAKNEEISVRYLNFKPEVADVWEKIAQDYTAETGIKVEIINTPSNENDKTLKQAIGKKNPPTLFQINGPVEYEVWKSYCRDLSDTDLYSWIVDKNMVITGTDGTGVYGIPYVVEGYGIIYNDEIMQKYFKLGSKSAKYTSVEEIKSYNALKEVVEDMTAHKSELGIDGVFASTSLQAGEEWRWQVHLLNLPIYCEYRDKNVNDLDELEYSYGDNFKNIFDLYLDNSVCARTEVGKKSVNDSMEEFSLGKCAMVQNGNWAWAQIAGTQGNVVKEENCKFLPIYVGAPDEANQGICIGTESYMSVNNLCSEEEQQASIDFLEWIYSSEKGKDYVINELQFITVFNTFGEDETPSNPLAREVSAYINDTSRTSVSWNFTTFPSQAFKDGLSEHLYKYAIGEEQYSELSSYIVSEWKLQKSK